MEVDLELPATQPAGPRAHQLSPVEKVGYSVGDAAANFVFMTMVLFQANFYTDVLGITATAAGAVLLIARACDAVLDPVVGYLADRTRSRWGKFRPWILATALPWSVLMVVAYTTPSGLSMTELVAYAIVTNALLMSVYSMNNMPYAALGSVMTSDVHERAKLNSWRFIAVNIAQFVVGGLTLPLVAKFSVGHDRQYGWRMTIGIWAVLCAVLFLVTFSTTRERVSSPARQATSLKLDIATLSGCKPWAALLTLTLLQYGMLTFRGAALYDYYHYYATEHAMYGFLHSIGLTISPSSLPTAWTRTLNTLGYIVQDHGPRASSNVADVFNSIINVLNTGVTITVLFLAPSLSRRFGSKTVSVAGFSMAGLATAMFYVLRPGDVWGMIALTTVIAACFAPTIPLVWAMYADMTDYIEWTKGRRLDGVTFATIGVALKFGLALGSSAFLWAMVALFHYNAKVPRAAGTVEGFRICATLITGVLLAACAVAVAFYELDKRATLRMAAELVSRRKRSTFGLREYEPLAAASSNRTSS